MLKKMFGFVFFFMSVKKVTLHNRPLFTMTNNIMEAVRLYLRKHGNKAAQSVPETADVFIGQWCRHARY